jgi:tRNA(Leu) C34 or U34 (ribose-2'-O)-methylase TrmL
VELRFLATAVENPGNRQRIADAADLLGGSCTAQAHGRLIAVENSPGARPVYGRPPLRGPATLALGHERRGLAPATLAAADETVVIPAVSHAVTTLNVAAAAAVAGWYVLRGSGPQARVAHPDRRYPAVLLSGDDHVEVGSSLRSAAAFGLREVFLDDRGAGWFDGPPARRREARAAARRHKNPLHVRRASPGLADGFEEVIVVEPAGPGRALARQPFARGRRQLVVIGAAPRQVASLPPGRLLVATTGLREVAHPPLRLVASIALAEIARQVGRPPPGRPPPAPRRPAYERELTLAAEGELLVLDPEVLLAY